MNPRDVLVATVCGLALVTGAGSVAVAAATAQGTSTPATSPAPEPSVCVSDAARPDGANGCEQDPMVVCMADGYYGEQATDAESRAAFAADAATYCPEVVSNSGR